MNEYYVYDEKNEKLYSTNGYFIIYLNDPYDLGKSDGEYRIVVSFCFFKWHNIMDKEHKAYNEVCKKIQESEGTSQEPCIFIYSDIYDIIKLQQEDVLEKKGSSSDYVYITYEHCTGQDATFSNNWEHLNTVDINCARVIRYIVNQNIYKLYINYI